MESANAVTTAGPSFTAGTAGVAIQLQVPSGGTIMVKEFGVSMATPQTTNALMTIRSTTTAATCTTAHTTTSIKPVDTNNVNAGASRLTFGATTNTGYGSGVVPATPTSLRKAAHLYVPQTYVYQYALGDEMEFGTNAIEYVQMILTTGVTSLATCWIKWTERI
jgi:hypothetical protein